MRTTFNKIFTSLNLKDLSNNLEFLGVYKKANDVYSFRIGPAQREAHRMLSVICEEAIFPKGNEKLLDYFASSSKLYHLFDTLNDALSFIKEGFKVNYMASYDNDLSFLNDLAETLDDNRMIIVMTSPIEAFLSQALNLVIKENDLRGYFISDSLFYVLNDDTKKTSSFEAFEALGKYARKKNINVIKKFLEEI